MKSTKASRNFPLVQEATDEHGVTTWMLGAHRLSWSRAVTPDADMAPSKLVLLSEASWRLGYRHLSFALYQFVPGFALTRDDFEAAMTRNQGAEPSILPDQDHPFFALNWKLAAIEEFKADAAKLGLPVPTPDEHVARLLSPDRTPKVKVSVDDLSAGLARNRELLARIDAGQLSSRQIGGLGGSKSKACRELSALATYFEIGLLTRGYLNRHSLDPLMEELGRAVSASRSLSAVAPAPDHIPTP
ncbi:hypothetical protein [Geopseudomonas aromaticivorans]